MKKAVVICIALIMLVLSNAGYAVVTKQSDMIHNSLFNITDFGAIGDGKTICTAAIQAAVDSCSEAGGGTVLVPAGVYVTAPFALKSDVTLHLRAGAEISGSTNIDDYYFAGGSAESERTGLIYARNARNTGITGHGVLNGNSAAFMNKNKVHIGPDFDRRYTRQGQGYMPAGLLTEDGPIAPLDRPGNMIRFSECEDVFLHDVTLIDSPTWTVHFADCDNVKVRGLSIRCDLLVPNSDGIHCTTSRNVSISDCFIEGGDDPIAITGFGDIPGKSKNVTVNNCTLVTRSCGVRVGYGDNSIENCTFQNLIIYANRGLGVFVRDKGSVRNIVFSNIIIESRLYKGHWWGNAEPIHVSAVPGTASLAELGKIDNIIFSNIIADSESGIVVYANDKDRIRNLRFKGIRLSINDSPNNSEYGGNIDLRPVQDMQQAIFKRDVPAFYARYVDDLQIEDLQLSWADDLPVYFSDGILCENFSTLSIDGFEGRQAPNTSTGAGISLRSGSHAYISNSLATHGTSTFLRYAGLTGQLLFVNNDLVNSNNAVAPDQNQLKMNGNMWPEN